MSSSSDSDRAGEKKSALLFSKWKVLGALTSLISKNGKNKEMKETVQTKESNEEVIWCGTLPDDVVLEILSRLPPKAFFRSKCVSKTWLALSSHAFRPNKHLLPTLLGFLYEDHRKIGFTNISGGGRGGYGGLPHYDEYDILDCCNGLVFLRCAYFSGYGCSSETYVYNPATQKHTAVPWPTPVKIKGSDEVYHNLFSLAFDPRAGLQFHVVCFYHAHDSEDGCTNIFSTFSSDSGKWQLGGNLGCDLELVKHSNGTFLDRRVHRVTQGHEIVSIDPINNSCSLTKFDFPGFFDDTGFSEIGQSHGLLHFMFGNRSRKLSIWVSENSYRQKWILKHQLSLDEMHFGDLYFSFGHIKLHPEKDTLLVHLKNGHILSIELRTGKSNKICVHPKGCSNLWLYMLFSSFDFNYPPALQ